MRSLVRVLVFVFVVCALRAATASAQIVGTVTDDTGGVLPGVVVEFEADGQRASTISDEAGAFRLEQPMTGAGRLTFTLVNFGVARRNVVVPAHRRLTVHVSLSLSLSADVLVSGRRTFTNLADAENPAENLVGVAVAASQGAITARQLEQRPVLRAGEVLETVPGMVVSQHSGEGKANQYYLRGFNLDHGTDFATSIAGMPVNMPTHGHGHGYSDLNFLISELVSGVQFSKGPYYAEQGDFATAGSAAISYVNTLDRPIVQAGGGGQGWGRLLAAASPTVASGALLGAVEVLQNDGPWARGDDYRRLNGVLRYSRGDARNGFSLTGMGYRATWSASDQVPQRAVAGGTFPRFGTIDLSAGGETTRVSGSLEWQRTRGNASTRLTAFGVGYGLDLFSNFTYFLDDPEVGDQFQQVDRRFVTGGRLAQRRIGRVFGRQMQHTVGVQVRHDDIGRVGLYRTQARLRRGTVREDAVLQTGVAGFAQNEIEWTPWLRSLAGLRVDGYRFDVTAAQTENSGVRRQGIVSPKGGLIVGPFRGTELYVNAGTGFHSNDARGATMTRDPATGAQVDGVTPLVRATGGEVGVRTVAFPRLQSSVSLWSLSLASELIFVGDAGTTEASRPSHRYGLEVASYYRPLPWLIVDADVSWSRAQFTDNDPAGRWIPGAVQTVAAGGIALAERRRITASARLRHFGPRPLVEDNSSRSRATTSLNGQAGYRIGPNVRFVIDGFNLLNSDDHDIDYFYASRLPGEPAGGVNDIHFHPLLPRTLRARLLVCF